MKPKIIFNKAAIPFICEALGIKRTESGTFYNDEGEILSPQGIQVTDANFGGIVLNNGKPMFITNDLWSIMELVDKNLKGMNI